MHHKALAAGALALLLAASQSAQANLIMDGNFDSPVAAKSDFLGNVPFWTGGAGLTFIDLPGTADDGSYLSVYGPFPTTSPAGGDFVEADAEPAYNSAIYQTVPGLTVGQAYTLTFYQAAGQQAGFTGPTTESWKVTFGDQTQVSAVFHLAQGGVGAWQQQTMTFIATSTSQVLSFLAVGTPNGAPPIAFLDGVDLQAAAVPEPSVLSLLGLGVAGMLLVARRRGQRA